jgi:hypothetical protein
MTRKQIDEYINKIINLKRSDIRKELDDLSGDIKYTIFLDTGGINYVLSKIAYSIFCSCKKIDNNIRIKISLFNLICKEYDSLFYKNECIENEKDNWYKNKYIKEREEKLKTVIPIIEDFLKSIDIDIDIENK